jgi:fructose-1-phosphate kinase PfkB-like protein
VLFERPLLAKLTVRELEVTLGERLSGERRILRGLRDLQAMGAQNVFVTQGGKPAYLMSPKRTWRLTPPAVNRRVNPIGSGDCTTAGLAHALLAGRSLKDAVVAGLACGSANVESLTPADLDVARMRVLRYGVKAEPL